MIFVNMEESTHSQAIRVPSGMLITPIRRCNEIAQMDYPNFVNFFGQER